MSSSAVIYARVSTKGQKDHGYSLATQVKGCKKYAQQNDLTVVDIIEDDISGATSLHERSGGQRLLEIFSNGSGTKRVIVWSLDRLSRPPEGEYSRLLTTIEQFGRYGAMVHDCETGLVDSGNPMSALLTFVKGIGASEERTRTRERTMRGKIAKAKAGKWVGGWAPYGFTKVGKGRDTYLVKNPVEERVVKRIFDLYTERNSKPVPLREIAEQLTAEGIPTPGRGMAPGSYWRITNMSNRILKNRVYIGEFSYKGIVNHFPDLAIIDEQTWELAQRRIEKKKVGPRRQQGKINYLLTGRLKCKCGGALTTSSTTGRKGLKYRYYRCSQSAVFGDLHDCDIKSIQAEPVEKEVWQWLVETIYSDERLEQAVEEVVRAAESKLDPLRDELATVAEMLRKTDQKIERLVSAFAEEGDQIVAEAVQGEIAKAAKLRESLANQRHELEDAIAATEQASVDYD